MFAIITFVALSFLAIVTTADAQQASFAPLGVAMQIGRAAPIMQLRGNNPYDPGCNANVGGLCGRDKISWCATWIRTNHGRVPVECQNQGQMTTQGYGGGMRGGYGGFGGVVGRMGVIVRGGTRTWHRHEEHREVTARLVPVAPILAPITQTERALLNSVYK